MNTVMELLSMAPSSPQMCSNTCWHVNTLPGLEAKAQQHRGHLVARPLVGQGELMAIGGGGLIYGEAREQHGHGGNTQFVDLALHHIAVEHAHLTGHHPHEKVEVRGQRLRCRTTLGIR